MPKARKLDRIVSELYQVRLMGSDEEVAPYLAHRIHSGPKAVDKSGEDYVLHPRRVALLVDAIFSNQPSELRTKAIDVAWLHDVIEDSLEHFGEQVTLEDLKEMGFSDDVIEAVDLVTKKEDYNEAEYLERIAANRIARIVKFADLMDNASPLRRSALSPKLKERYSRYWQRLVIEDTFFDAR